MIFVLVGPGGSGKTTLANEIVKRDSNIEISRSWTTRPRRSQELPDAYTFASDEEFESLLESGGFIETDSICGYRYGTPKANLETSRDVLVILTADGASNLDIENEEIKIFFIDCPSVAEQIKRMHERGSGFWNMLRRTLTGFAERRKAKKYGWQRIVNVDIVETTNIIYSTIKKSTSKE